MIVHARHKAALEVTVRRVTIGIGVCASRPLSSNFKPVAPTNKKGGARHDHPAPSLISAPAVLLGKGHACYS